MSQINQITLTLFFHNNPNLKNSESDSLKLTLPVEKVLNVLFFGCFRCAGVQESKQQIRSIVNKWRICGKKLKMAGRSPQPDNQSQNNVKKSWFAM